MQRVTTTPVPIYHPSPHAPPLFRATLPASKRFPASKLPPTSFLAQKISRACRFSSNSRRDSLSVSAPNTVGKNLAMKGVDERTGSGRKSERRLKISIDKHIVSKIVIDEEQTSSLQRVQSRFTKREEKKGGDGKREG